MLVNPANAYTERIVRDVGQAARVKGLRLHVLNAASNSDFEPAFASLAVRAGALLVGNDPFFFSRHERLVALAARHGVPAIYEWREFAAAGGLASYGTSIAAMYDYLGVYVGRVLSGVKPADLPVYQPTNSSLSSTVRR
jgi:putative ABC transport system substrate-binding protein